MQQSRKFTEARQAQGFKSQGHLDAFYRSYDHNKSCDICSSPGPAMWLEGSASWQPTMQECDEGRELFAASLSENFYSAVGKAELAAVTSYVEVLAYDSPGARLLQSVTRQIRDKDPSAQVWP